MIRHTVTFRLHHAAGSAEEEEEEEEEDFLAAGRTLADLPGVRAFEQLRHVSPKNDVPFGFSMEFASRAAYDAYDAHPAHLAFAAERWLPEVADFLEIDYTPLG